MVKRTHGEKRRTIRGVGLARRKQKPRQRSVSRKSCTFIEIFFRNRLTKSRRDGKIYRQSAVAVKIESGRVPEWPMGTDCKSAAFQLRWFESTRAHQKTSTYESTLRFLFCMCVKFTNAGGFEQHRPAVQSGGQKSPCATATTAASGRNREELLGLRPAGCACRPRHDAAAGSRDPDSLFCAARDIHPRPSRDPVSEPGAGSSVLWKLFQSRAERRQM